MATIFLAPQPCSRRLFLLSSHTHGQTAPKRTSVVSGVTFEGPAAKASGEQNMMMRYSLAFSIKQQG